MLANDDMTPYKAKAKCPWGNTLYPAETHSLNRNLIEHYPKKTFSKIILQVEEYKEQDSKVKSTFWGETVHTIRITSLR